MTKIAGHDCLEIVAMGNLCLDLFLRTLGPCFPHAQYLYTKSSGICGPKMILWLTLSGSGPTRQFWEKLTLSSWGFKFCLYLFILTSSILHSKLPLSCHRLQLPSPRAMVLVKNYFSVVAASWLAFYNEPYRVYTGCHLFWFLFIKLKFCVLQCIC